MSSPLYEKAAVNTVKRMKERAIYDYKTVHSIINTSPVVHVGFNPVAPADNPFPAILPMLGVTGSYTSQEADPATSVQDIYIHGYVSSRLMKQSSPRDDEGTPVTVAATLMDGLVISLTPNHHSCNYRSAVVFGYAALVTDEAEKMWAMEHITNNMIPDLWAHGRIPPTKAEMTSTSILRVRISYASAKVRSGEPGDDRHDLKDEELKKRVWTGVVPSWTQWGEPIPASTNRAEDTPGFMESWRAVANKDARVGAYEAAKEKES